MLVELVTLIGSLLSLWLICFVAFNDFGVSSKKVNGVKRALFIFPHPDDEVIGTGGLIHLLMKIQVEVIVVILTHGEKGNEKMIHDANLKRIRAEEAKKAHQVLNSTHLMHLDLGDGKLPRRQKELMRLIEILLHELKPDLVVTYDNFGLYGHHDHMIVSELITGIIKKLFPSIALWYVSYPQKILDRLTIPDFYRHPDRQIKPLKPTHKVFLGSSLLKKIHALRKYSSQRKSFQKAAPISWVPIELFFSFQLYEYYAVQTESDNS